MSGNNYFHVKEGIAWAKKYSLEHGPLFIEVDCYRYHGHSMSDPGTSYRSREEVKEYRKQKDCIEFLRKNILDSKIVNEEELNVMNLFKC
jgi:pyruvate dehydrogenase E1 component alpha subunit